MREATVSVTAMVLVLATLAKALADALAWAYAGKPAATGLAGSTRVLDVIYTSL